MRTNKGISKSICVSLKKLQLDYFIYSIDFFQALFQVLYDVVLFETFDDEESVFKENIAFKRRRGNLEPEVFDDKWSCLLSVILSRFISCKTKLHQTKNKWCTKQIRSKYIYVLGS